MAYRKNSIDVLGTSGSGIKMNFSAYDNPKVISLRSPEYDGPKILMQSCCAISKRASPVHK